MLYVGNYTHPALCDPWYPAFGGVASVRGYGGQPRVSVGRGGQLLIGTRGYGQEGEGPAPTVTAEDLAAATAAAEAAAEESEKQYLLAQQAIGFNTQLIAGFVASAAFGIVATALGTALMKGKEALK